MFLLKLEKDVAKVEEANKAFRSLISLHGYVGLLSDVYCTPVFSHGKSASSVIEAFVLNDSEIIPSLGKLHRYLFFSCHHLIFNEVK